MDVAIHAAFNPKQLAGRCTWMVRPQSGIKPGKVVEDADGTDGLVNDETTATGFNRLWKGSHGTGLAFRIPSCRA